MCHKRCGIRLLLAVAALLSVEGAQQQCSSTAATKPDYSSVFAHESNSTIPFASLPGFTRSVHAEDHALVAPESRVWLPAINWQNSETCHIISPIKRSHLSMYLARMKAGSEAPPKPEIAERFILVVDGVLTVKHEGKDIKLPGNHYVYFPPMWDGSITSKDGASLLVFERIFAKAEGLPVFVHGNVEDSPLLPVEPEMFKLRKLLPRTDDFDFNVHVMDFEPGEFLYVKEVHYNQHGLLMLEGQGIYRLGNNWYPVQAGDAIWIAPYVPQWFGALGKTRTRYILYKDTNVDPLVSP